MEKKEMNKVVVAVIAVALIIAIVGGATFAYWQWQTSTEQQTQVNVTVAEGISMVINPTSASFAGLRPTNDCDKMFGEVPSHIRGVATVTVNNQTGILAKPSFRLKGKVEKGGSGALDADDLKHINYAVFDGTVNSCTLSSALHTGTFSGVNTNGSWTDLMISAAEETGTGKNGDDLNNASTTTADYVSNATFDAAAYATTEHTYTVYVWIDPDYTHTNVGDQVSDPLQNATISITWSENSKVDQITS